MDSRGAMRRIRLSSGKQVKSQFSKSGIVLLSALALACRASAQVQGNSPWENAVNVLQTAFTGPIAKGLALVSIVVGGLTFAFGEGGGKRTFAGIVFGVGMSVLAVNFFSRLFGVEGCPDHDYASKPRVTNPESASNDSWSGAQTLLFCACYWRLRLQPPQQFGWRTCHVFHFLSVCPVGDAN